MVVVQMTKVVESGYSYEEQEVSANYNQGQWIIYASRKPHITKLMRQYGDDVEVLEKLGSGTPVLVRVVLNDDLVSFRKPMTEEQKHQRSKQLELVRSYQEKND